MNFTSLGRVSWFLQMLLAMLLQSFSTFLNSLNSIWGGHPNWLQLHDDHDCAPNSDTVPRSSSYRAYNEALILKLWNQCLNLFQFQWQAGLWQGCSLWRRNSGRVWIAQGQDSSGICRILHLRISQSIVRKLFRVLSSFYLARTDEEGVQVLSTCQRRGSNMICKAAM